jgi:hypothetical protein
MGFKVGSSQIFYFRPYSLAHFHLTWTLVQQTESSYPGGQVYKGGNQNPYTWWTLGTQNYLVKDFGCIYLTFAR